MKSFFDNFYNLAKVDFDDTDWMPVTDANLAEMQFFKIVVEKAAGE